MDLRASEIEQHNVDAADPLRREAQTLYESCLTDGKTDPLRQFLERQLTQSPPPLDLLQDIASDLQQRCLTLRGHYFDIREKVVQVFQQHYHADLSRLTPPSQFDRYHQLEAETLLAVARQHNLAPTPSEMALLHRMVRGSLVSCKSLHRDIELTMQLQALVEDWLSALQITTAQQEQAFSSILLFDPPLSRFEFLQ